MISGQEPWKILGWSLLRTFLLLIFKRKFIENIHADNKIFNFRESTLLYEDKISPESRKEGVLSIISHEFGHQWFGDYVTTDWWGTIW